MTHKRASFRTFVAVLALLGTPLTGCSPEQEPVSIIPTPDYGAFAAAAVASCGDWANDLRLDILDTNDVAQTCTNLLNNTAKYNASWPDNGNVRGISGSIVAQVGHRLNDWKGGERAQDLAEEIIEHTP